MPVDELSQDELVRLYGRWAGRVPADAVALLSDYPGRWWVAGGWAIESFTGVERPHGDLDLGIPRAELPLLRRYLAGRLDVWTATRGALSPLLPMDSTSPPDECGDLWLRAGGDDPWLYDVLLTTHRDQDWVFQRNPAITHPLSDIVRVRDGVPFLRPEIQLLHKAKRVRAKYQADFDCTWPRLDAAQRRWLHHAIATVHPDHRWLAAPG